MFSESTDGGATWSPEAEISGEAAGVCPNECANDQGSAPFIGPDGTIYVAFANNDAIDRPGQQILFVKCPDDEDCTQEEAWTEPVIVEDLILGSPSGQAPAAVPRPIPACPERLPRPADALHLELGGRQWEHLRRLGGLSEQHERRLHRPLPRLHHRPRRLHHLLRHLRPHRFAASCRG